MKVKELLDLEFYFQLRENVYKIESAQRALKSVFAHDLNTELKEAMSSLEKARQNNHKMLCAESDRIER